MKPRSRSPPSPKTSACRPSAHHFQTQGENISLTGSERDGYRNNTLQWGGRWHPSTETDLRFSIRRTHANAEYDGFGPTDAPYTSRNRRTYLNASLHSQAGSFQYQANIGYLQTANLNEVISITETKGRRIQVDRSGMARFRELSFRATLHNRCWFGVESGTLHARRRLRVTRRFFSAKLRWAFALHLFQRIHDAEMAT